MSKREGDRQQQILRELAEIPTLRIGDTVYTYGVPTETICCDFDELTRRGALNRTHGSAMRAVNSKPTVIERHWLFTEERERIARDAVHCMHEGKIFMIGSGATTIHIARWMASELWDITVITHALGAATVLSMNPTIRVIVAPGEYCAIKGAITGMQTLQFFSQSTANYMLLGASGIVVDGPNEALIDSGTIHRVMIQRAARSIVVVDHPKFDLTYPYHYAGQSGISRSITDRPLPNRLATILGREKVVVACGHAAPEQQ